MSRKVKIKGTFSQFIPNEAGIPSESKDAEKVRSAHRQWKKSAKKHKCKEVEHLTYWQQASRTSL